MHRPTPPPSPLDAFVTRDHAMLRILDEIVLWLRDYRSAAISGESGVGKSLAAYLVHQVVARPGVPALVRDALEVAHPWATPAEDHTIVLDHLDRWPVAQQLALLAKLGPRPRPRLLALSRVPSARLVAEGRLLPELAAWWTDREAELPPLRARPDDLVLLVGSYLRHKGRASVEVEPAAWRALSEHGWPDNVRELESVLDEALARVTDDRLDHAHLSLDPLAPPSLTALADNEFDQVRRTVDGWYLRRLLHQTRGNISEAARRSGCSRKVLRDRLRRHGLYAARLAELDDDGSTAAEPLGPGWGSPYATASAMACARE